MFERLQRILKGDDPEQTHSTSVDYDSCWTSHAVDDRMIQVFRPRHQAELTGVILFLHGHGEVTLNRNQVFSQCLQNYGLAAVCPSGGPCWWLDLVCPDFHPKITPHQWLKTSVMEFIGEQFPQIRTPPALLGVSMGGQGVLQLAYQNARLFPIVAAISPTVDFHQLYGSGIALDRMFPDAEQARQATVVLNLHPLSWPAHQFFCCDPADHDWFDGAARLGMKLSSSGILHERDLETSGGGHSWDYFNLMADAAISHCASGLQKVAADLE